ncbi:MAG TPA: ester cyclase [Streptosporangiaceae bacterium]|nr:ester cyclase [Streptosporangiaceae bacterium]
MPVAANTAKLQQLMDEVLTKHNLDVLDEVFHADYVERDPPPGMGPGREGLRQWLAGWIAAFPDAQWAIEEQIAEGDQVWTRSVWQGTHQGPFLGVPATGKHVTVGAWTIDRFTDGKISDSRLIMDALGLMMQLGVAPGAPPA